MSLIAQTGLTTISRKAGHRPTEGHVPEVLHFADKEKLSQRGIAERLGISKMIVNEILKRRGASLAADQRGTR